MFIYSIDCINVFMHSCNQLYSCVLKCYRYVCMYIIYAYMYQYRQRYVYVYACLIIL